MAEALARATAAGVGHCDALVLTSGETAAAVLKALGAGSFTVLGEIEPGVAMSLLPNVSQSFEGPLTEAALERMSFDRVFLGADAVTAEDGICEADQRDS